MNDDQAPEIRLRWIFLTVVVIFALAGLWPCVWGTVAIGLLLLIPTETRK